MMDLVTSLNEVIEAAVLDANNLVGRNVTHFVTWILVSKTTAGVNRA